MNIKEHIEAGHYPKDEKGRALVSMKNGETAVICATDNPYGGVPIVGWCNSGPDSWGPNGVWKTGGDKRDLLPPPPRKVKVTRWLVVNCHRIEYGPYEDEDDAKATARHHGAIIVPLTGEYEEPWS